MPPIKRIDNFSPPINRSALFLLLVTNSLFGQQPPYDVFLEAKPPYHRVRYEAPKEPGELIFPVNYTIWIPPGAKTVRGVIVHQHGCGEGSCKSGLMGAFDLHWQALAKKHNCALLGPSYEQPGKADCQMWCDPRNGSGEAFQKGLADLATQSGHPELEEVPPSFNVCPDRDNPTIAQIDGRVSSTRMRWDLVSNWSKELRTDASSINARSETMAEKPFFRNSFRNRRCLAPADGWYEWRTEGKRKIPFFIHLPREEPFAFASLWDSGERT